MDEKYTEIEEVPATRQREVWVKQVIEEPYLKKVEVERTRRVKKPTTAIQEIDALVEVDVPVSRVVGSCSAVRLSLSFFLALPLCDDPAGCRL